MAVPDWIWFIFIFAFGCCIGSFLNVVIYRLPRDQSLIKPPSACPACGVHIRFYDNIPLISWLLLGAKCRYCKAPISPRYFVIELLTGLVFVGLFFLFFYTDLCAGVGKFLQGGWFVLKDKVQAVVKVDSLDYDRALAGDRTDRRPQGTMTTGHGDRPASFCDTLNGRARML